MADRWAEAIHRLTRMTRDGAVKWAPSPDVAKRRGQRLRVIGPAFVAEAFQKRIAVFEYGYESTDDSENEFPTTGVSAEFIDRNGDIEWVWPATDGLFELLDAIRFQTSHANDFLDRILEGAPVGAGAAT